MAIDWQHVLGAADAGGVKLELVEGIPTWEFFPSSKHQKWLDRIRSSVRTSNLAGVKCGCYSLQDTYFRFPDGTYKRPDLSLFCSEPPEIEDALEILPDAIVEIVSSGFEKKDLETGAPFYISQGVKEVVVVNPVDSAVHHFTKVGCKVFPLPITIKLLMGCEFDV